MKEEWLIRADAKADTPFLLRENLVSLASMPATGAQGKTSRRGEGLILNKIQVSYNQTGMVLAPRISTKWLPGLHFRH
jgi:hypothetical protein